MRHPHRPIVITGVAILATTALASPALASPAHGASHKTWHVSPGTGTISTAVAMAKAGDTIVLKAGTFFDSVFVDKTLTIRGAGWSRTTIKPPATSTNPCNQPGSIEGICALGAFDALGNPDLTKPVKNVKISDLRLTGFEDGVLGLNTKGLTVRHVRSDHNTGYGIARFASTLSNFSENWTSWNGEAGLYMGDSPNAASVIRHNKADHNGIGIFMRDSTGLTATGNTAWGNCIGILALNSGAGAPGDLPAGNYKITGNSVSANDKECAPDVEEGIPGYSGLGIALAGVHDVVVRDNKVSNNRSTNASDLPKGGIVIFSTAFLGGADPTNNRVVGNELKNNAPADIFWDGTGTGNKVKGNECRTAIPGNLGWCSH
jgi:parallel beta-helix repeat protein